ncbi:MAG TPA: phospholipase D-like domain-containing protein [Bordetella sp.]|uniref:phospholipase D-like domain-containing protein n=1 Tax=Bordetella sp. TaxID=28081 RepID=UPI002ED34965
MRLLIALVLCLPLSVLAEPVSLTGATVETYFSPGGGAGAAAARFIDAAKHRVYLAGYGFTNRDIAAALRRAKERGLIVRVVLDHSNATAHYSGATYLANAGVDVRIDCRYPIMHHKFIVSDDNVAFGSMNFTKAGDAKNAENFNLFRGAPKLTAEYATEFRRLYEESRPYSRVQ